VRLRCLRAAIATCRGTAKTMVKKDLGLTVLRSQIPIVTLLGKPFTRSLSRNAVITIAIRLRHDYDPTTTYRARCMLPFDASKK